MRLGDFLHRIGKGARRVVAGLFLKRGKVEGATVDARWGAGFEAAGFKAERDQALGGLFGGGLAGASSAVREIADVNFAAQEGASREDDGASSVGDAALDADALNGSVLD